MNTISARPLRRHDDPSTWHAIARHHRNHDAAGVANQVRRLIDSLLHQSAEAWRRYRARREDRAAVERMLSLDAKMLDDIGITHADLQYVLSLPLSVKATTELELIARGRTRRR